MLEPHPVPSGHPSAAASVSWALAIRIRIQPAGQTNLLGNKHNYAPRRIYALRRPPSAVRPLPRGLSLPCCGRALTAPHRTGVSCSVTRCMQCVFFSFFFFFLLAPLRRTVRIPRNPRRPSMPEIPLLHHGGRPPSSGYVVQNAGAERPECTTLAAGWSSVDDQRRTISSRRVGRRSRPPAAAQGE